MDPEELGAWGDGQSWSRTLELGDGPAQELSRGFRGSKSLEGKRQDSGE